MSVTWTPAVPSLQSWVSFNITGVSVSYSGLLDPRLVFDFQGSQFWLNDDTGIEPILNTSAGFSFVSGIPIPGPLVMPSGLYQYHIYLWGDSAFCMQEVVGNITIGTTVPFTILDFAWTPEVIKPDSPSSIILKGVNGPEDPLNIKECRLEILTIPSQLLDLVACEVSEIQPSAPFQLTSAPIKFPDLKAGNYTVRVHFYDTVELGYVETGLQVAGEYPLALLVDGWFLALTNNGKDTITIGAISTDTFSSAGVHIIDSDIFTVQLKTGETWNEVPPIWWWSNETITLTVCVDVYNDKNVTIGFFNTSVVLNPQIEVTSVSAFPTTLNSSDILLIEVEGTNVTELSYCLIGYEGGNCPDSPVMQTDGRTYALVSMDLSESHWTPGSYLLTFNYFNMYSAVIINVTESKLPASPFYTLNNSFPEQFTPGGCIDLNATVLGNASDTTCHFSVANNSFTLEWGEVYCEQTQDQALYELVLPVIPLPAQFNGMVSGPYIVKVELVNSTGDIVNNIREAVYLDFEAQISPGTLSISPTSISVNDTLNVTLTGQALTQFSNMTLQSATLYNSSKRVNFPSLLSVSNLAWQGNSVQVNASMATIWPNVTGNYTLGLCLETGTLGLYCWRTNTTLISGYRLAMSEFQWNQSNPLIAGSTVTLSFNITSRVPGYLSQNLCNVTILLGNTVTLNKVIVCEAELFYEGETVEVTSGALQLPASLVQGEYAVSIQFLSSTYLVYAVWDSFIGVQEPTPTPNPSNAAVGLLLGLSLYLANF